MEAVRRLVLLAFLMVPCLADLNLTKSEGKKIEPVVFSSFLPFFFLSRFYLSNRERERERKERVHK